MPNPAFFLLGVAALIVLLLVAGHWSAGYMIGGFQIEVSFDPCIVAIQHEQDGDEGGDDDDDDGEARRLAPYLED
jgi:hypothetical protein